MTSTKSTPAHDSPEAGFVSPLSLELRIFHLYGECSDNYTIVYYYGKRTPFIKSFSIPVIHQSHFHQLHTHLYSAGEHAEDRVHF